MTKFNLLPKTKPSLPEAKDSKSNFLVNALVGLFIAGLCISNGCETVADDGTVYPLIPYDIFGMPFWGVGMGEGKVPWWDLIKFIMVWSSFLIWIVIPVLQKIAPWLITNPETERLKELAKARAKMLKRFGINRNSTLDDTPTPGDILKAGFIRSAFAGFFEEVAFRWLMFLSMFATMAMFDVFPFFGLISWTHVEILAPVANWATLGYLESYLFDPNWLVGGAVIYTNSLFRNGHSYQGPLGYTNSWFLGMVFFWIMFNFGLWAAIVIHFVYDMWLFTQMAFMQWAQNQRNQF